MNLLSPAILFWLLPLAGTIIVLWMLKLRRQDQEVSSLYLWRTLLRETQANAPFQKLRRNLLLFLQLLAAFLLLFALSKPYSWGRALNGRTYVLMIDASASMNATDVSPSRLELAKQTAEAFVDHMRDADVAMVIDVTNKPIALSPFTSDKNRLRTAIQAVKPTDTIADMPTAFTIAQSAVGQTTGASVHVYTDGGFSNDDVRRIQTRPLANTEIVFEPIGGSSPDNLAITALDARRDPVSNAYQVFVDIQEFGGPRQHNASLSLYKDGRIIDARPLDLSKGSVSLTFGGQLLAQGGVVTAQIDDAGDDLASDNTASIVLPAPRKRKILLVSDGNLFLERGLNLDPDVALDEVSPADYARLGKSGAGYGMVVFDGWLPADLGPGNYLIFDAASPQTPLEAAAGSADYPEIIDQSRTHPVMRFVDLSGLAIYKSLRATIAPWADQIAETDNGPMIAAGDHDGRHIVSVGFSITDSNWPLRISFPIFLSNCIDWLTAANGLGPSSMNTPAGGVASIGVPAGLATLSVVKPDGHEGAIEAPQNGGLVAYDDTSEAGLYKISGGRFQTTLAVDLLDRTESNLTVQTHLDLERKGNLVAASRTRRVKDDWWPIVAAVALGILAIEWLLYHRRI